MGQPVSHDYQLNSFQQWATILPPFSLESVSTKKVKNHNREHDFFRKGMKLVSYFLSYFLRLNQILLFLIVIFLRNYFYLFL